MSQREYPHLQRIQPHRQNRPFVVTIIIEFIPATDSESLLLLDTGDGVEDCAYGTEDVELDDCAPEDTFFSECGWGVEALEFWVVGLWVGRFWRGSESSRLRVVDLPNRLPNPMSIAKFPSTIKTHQIRFDLITRDE